LRERMGWEVEIVTRSDAQPKDAFAVQPHRWIVEGTQSQSLQSALDVQVYSFHERSHRATEPAHCSLPAAGSSAGLCVDSSGSWCAMSVISSQPEILASAPPRP
jgi:hypothetical protein